VLINSAGIMPIEAIERLPDEWHRKVFEVSDEAARDMPLACLDGCLSLPIDQHGHAVQETQAYRTSLSCPVEGIRGPRRT